MPELPEVEVTKQGISSFLLGYKVSNLKIYNSKLRWPVLDDAKKIIDQEILKIQRRGKYIIVETAIGQTLIHLGMSGHLSIVSTDTPLKKHDHIELIIGDKSLRYNDPRRFGSWIWYEGDIFAHKLLVSLGPEPLTKDFSVSYLIDAIKNRRQPIKQVLMDSKVVVGVGNIYANEALFAANINPLQPANSLTKIQLKILINKCQDILKNSIATGGTTLKDFSGADGKPGYFVQKLQVYGQGGNPCPICQTVLASLTLGGRKTTYCPNCQPLLE